jgi:PIN domain nuclease of toxin-antitoxin system
MNAVVLDASALLALLLGEPGAGKVADRLSDAVMSVFNFAEVASYFYKLGMSDRQVAAILKPLPMMLVPGDEELAWDAGRLRAVTASAGLSLGDRFCLALARKRKLPALTSDKVWESIAQAIGVEIIVIR